MTKNVSIGVKTNEDSKQQQYSRILTLAEVEETETDRYGRSSRDLQSREEQAAKARKTGAASEERKSKNRKCESKG